MGSACGAGGCARLPVRHEPLCAIIIERGGPGWPNVPVILFFWNGAKFAVMSLLTPIAWARGLWSDQLARSGREGPGSREALRGPTVETRVPGSERDTECVGHG